MDSLTRLRSERYSSSSGHRLSGPLLQSYHGSPRHSFRQQKKTTSPAAVLARVVLVLLALVGCFVGGKHYLHKQSGSKDTDLLASLLGSSQQHSPAGSGFWPPSDLSFNLPRPSWGKSAPADPAAADAAVKALKGTRAGRLFGEEGYLNKQQQPARGSLGSVEYNSQQQQQEAGAASPSLPPSTWLSNKQSQLKQEQQADTSTDDALLSSSDVRPVSTPVPTPTASTATVAAAGAGAAGSKQQAVGADHHDFDPLHDNFTASEKEAEQLSALSRVIQQQQDTITKQASALQELQKRFDQQEHQLQAATATAASANGAENVQIEPYFPEDKVQQELTMLHKVEAQIEAVSKTVDEATKALPNLTREQQQFQLKELERADQLMNRLSRVAAAINLRTSDPLTESGHDPVVELRHYYGTVANDLTLDWQEALNRQSRPTADELGLSMDPFTDSMSDLDTLDLRLEYVAAMMKGMHDSAPCRLGLVTTWSGDLWGLRKELIPWLTYHAYLGVSRLYLLYEGSDERTLRELMALKPWVTVTLASAPLATKEEVSYFDAWVNTVHDAHIKEWKSQPGNYHLMTKQGYAVTTALQMARADNVTWLMHMDPDELLHPGASHSAGMLAGTYSLLPELCNAPAHVPSIRFVNVEGVPEAADIVNRYEQVTLFRAHRHLVPPQIQPFRYIFKQGHADAWLHLYTNGKSAVRPDAPGVTQGGPHTFLGPADKRWATRDNPHGIWRPAISNSTLVLHYAYATPGDVAVKAGRSCPPGVVEQVLAGNTSEASKCFVLDLDQRAFMAAVKDRKAAGLTAVPALPHVDPAADNSSRLSSGPIEVDPATYFGSSTSSGFSNTSWPVGQSVLDFFWGELTLSEGAPFECLTPDGKSTGWCSMKDVDKLKSLLISSGLMMRLHAPAQTMKGIETAIQQLMLLGHRKPSDPNIPWIVLKAPPHEAAEEAMEAAAAARAGAAGGAAAAAGAVGAQGAAGAATSGSQQQASGGQQQVGAPGGQPAQAQGGDSRQLQGDADHWPIKQVRMQEQSQGMQRDPTRDPSRDPARAEVAAGGAGWEQDKRLAGQGGWEQRKEAGRQGRGSEWDGRPRQQYDDRYYNNGRQRQGEEPQMRAWFDRPDRRMREQPPGAYRGRWEGPQQGQGGGRQGPTDTGAYNSGRRVQQDGAGAAGGARYARQAGWGERGSRGPADAGVQRDSSRQEASQQGASLWGDSMPQQQQRQVPRPQQQEQRQLPRPQQQEQKQQQKQQQPVQPQRQRGWQDAEVPPEHVRDRTLSS